MGCVKSEKKATEQTEDRREGSDTSRYGRKERMQTVKERKRIGGIQYVKDE